MSTTSPTPDHSDPHISRRFLKTSAAAALGGTLATDAARSKPGAESEQANVIARENAKPGARDWQLTRVRLDKIGGFRSPHVEGYKPVVG